MSIAITIDAKGFKEAERDLAGVKNGFPRAAARSINAGLRAGRTMAAKLIRQKYAIKASDIKAQGLEIKQARANWDNLHGSLEAKGKMLPLALFSPRTRGKGPKRVVTVQITKKGRRIVKGAFMPDGRRVMERRQSARYPIFPVFTIGVPHMLGSLSVGKQVEERMAQVVTAELKRNTAFYLKGHQI
jgi:minor tail protein Z (GPZ)